MSEISNSWFDDYENDFADGQIDEYDITSTPNDFNVSTLFHFIESGAVKIPGFQRNFVWDRTRSSKLIESLILGIPVPQLFLYEQARNKFLVIDGQQRLMSVYYFIKKRFPRNDKRVEIRGIFDENGIIPDEILFDDIYFEDFKLKLSGKLPNEKNKFHGLNYSTLGDYKTQLDLRPIRNIIVKQNSTNEDDSAIYEVFNRLNTGGVNLRPQEIRTSMYHSNFYEMLYRVNQDSRWRQIIGNKEPDLHMKDIEILLRGFAMLIEGERYAPSLVRFLNRFSRLCATHTPEQNTYLEELFVSFLAACAALEDNAFINARSGRFNIALFEATFTAVSLKAFKDKQTNIEAIKPEQLTLLANDQSFIDASSEGTTSSSNVQLRLNIAQKYLDQL